MLPASNPLRATKFKFSTARANTPTTRRGKMVMTDPANNQSAPAELKTVEKNFAPAVNPTAAKKRAMPNSRKAKFTLAGICQTSCPIRPMRPSTSATTSTPPAKPSHSGCGNPGIATGIVPMAIPNAMPRNSGMKCVSLSSLSEFPRKTAAFSMLAWSPTNWSTSPKCRRRLGTALISRSALVTRVIITPCKCSRPNSVTVPSTRLLVTTTPWEVMPPGA